MQRFQVLIKDIKLKNMENSVGANCVRPRAFTERPYGMCVQLSLPQGGKVAAEG